MSFKSNSKYIKMRLNDHFYTQDTFYIAKAEKFELEMDKNIYDFTLEKDYLGCCNSENPHSLKKVYYQEPIDVNYQDFNHCGNYPKIDIGDLDGGVENHEFPSTTVINQFEMPISSPFDFVELNYMDDFNELKTILNHGENQELKDIKMEFTHEEVTKNGYIKEESSNIQETNQEFTDNQKKILKNLKNMGFSSDVVNYFSSFHIPEQVDDYILDRVIDLQDIYNQGIGFQSVDYLRSYLGDDFKIIKLWTKNIATLKELGCEEAAACESMIHYGGNVHQVIDNMNK